jgi:L-seryl-tRNA(Ser) seleniumtransferase
MASKTTNARANAVYNTRMSEGKKSEISEISALRHVPSVDQLLRTEVARLLIVSLGLKRVTAIARTVTTELRSLIRNDQNTSNGYSPEVLLAEAVRRMEETAKLENETGIGKVINATGVLLHTNLGRAPPRLLQSRV